MPESVRDRLSRRHELIFLLVKQHTYWFDLDPIREPHTATRRETEQQHTRPPGRIERGIKRPPHGESLHSEVQARAPRLMRHVLTRRALRVFGASGSGRAVPCGDCVKGVRR